MLSHTFLALLLAASLFADPTVAVTTDRVVLREDQRYCISRSGSNIELQRCSGSNDYQEWNFNSGGEWRSAANDNDCVSVDTVTSTALLSLGSCSSGGYREWEHETDQTIRPMNNPDDYCITYETDTPHDGDNIKTTPCSDAAATDDSWEWAITRYQMMVLDSDSDYCIGPKGSVANGVYLELQDCDDGDNSQLFRLVDGGTIRPYYNSDLCVDSTSTDRLRLETCNDSRGQNWYIASSSRVRSDASGDCVRYETSTPATGRDIVVDYSCSSSDPFRWDFVNQEDWSSSSSSANEMLVLRTNTDYCIGLENGVAANGNRLELARCNENDDSFYWEYSSKQLRPKEDSRLCAEVDGTEAGEQIRLRSCSSTEDNMKFEYLSIDEEFALERDNTVCLSFLGNTNNNGKPIVLDECLKNGRQIWARTERVDYPPAQYTSESTTPANQLIVADDDNRFCITVTSTSPNGLLRLDNCNIDDDKQKWTLTSNGKLYPKQNSNVCADVQSLLSGKDVLLQTCGSLNQNLWSYDTSTLKAGSSNLCMTYASTSPSIAANDVIELTQCTNAATWKFYDTVAYSSDISGRSFEKVHIVSMEDSSKCLSVSSASNRADVIYANCNLSDQRQNWATNELGQMFLKDYTNLCIQVLRYTTGTDVKLRECDSSKQSQQFVFDGNHDNEITPVITADLCLTYDTRRRLRDRNLQFLRRKMTLELCNGSDAQGWIFND